MPAITLLTPSVLVIETKSAPRNTPFTPLSANSAIASGDALAALDLARLEALWQEAKRHERAVPKK